MRHPSLGRTAAKQVTDMTLCPACMWASPPIHAVTYTTYPKEGGNGLVGNTATWTWGPDFRSKHSRASWVIKTGEFPKAHGPASLVYTVLSNERVCLAQVRSWELTPEVVLWHAFYDLHTIHTERNKIKINNYHSYRELNKRMYVQNLVYFLTHSSKDSTSNSVPHSLLPPFLLF